MTLGVARARIQGSGDELGVKLSREPPGRWQAWDCGEESAIICRDDEIIFLTHERFGPMRGRLDAIDWKILRELQGDGRMTNVRTLNDVWRFPQYATLEDWQAEASRIREHIMVCSGLHPLPDKCPLEPQITGRIEREGRFLGWGRALLEATWQQFDESGGRAPNLPPEASGRAALFWENHFFQEDGILQLGLVGWRRGAMDDPWDVTRAYRLPAITTVDLLVGFRLVGAHLSLNFKNLTGQKHQLTAGTWSSGQEMDMRLMWSFRH